MKLIYIYTVLVMMLVVGCTSFDADNRLEEALTMADLNRTEMEKVLSHYEENSMKKEAAKFLIRNMPGHYSYVDTAVIIRYSHSVDSILETMKDSSFNSIRDSINSCAKRFNLANLKKCQDIKSISSTYLIKNIDKAFDSWQKGAWATHLSFDDFCEYILPYKVHELQLLDDWRFRLTNFHSEKMSDLNRCDAYRNSTLEACRTLIRNYSIYIQPQIDEDIQYPTMKWEIRTKVPFGTCEYFSYNSLALLRSNGIPVVADFTPHWACRRLGHSWNVLISENGYHYPFDAGGALPGDSYRLSEKLAKAYRHTYAINEELVDLNNSEKNVPSLFKTIFIKDVTADYISSTNVCIKSSELIKEKKYAFLAIFGDRDWTPICFGKVSRKKVLYKNIGRNSLYMPYCYNDSGKINAIASPFIVSLNGKVKEININPKKKIDMILRRKYPALEYSCSFLHRLDSCEFQASNDIDFKKYKTVHKIGKCHGIGYNVGVSDSIPAYRYWRFFSTKPETHANVAEIYFFDISGKEIKGKVIGTEGAWGNRKDYTRDAVFDGDILTFFDAPNGDGSWVGMDFGKPVRISHFYYFARGDGNAIAPNDKYELFYWDNSKWNSLGAKKATSPVLVFKKVPSGGVYLLRNLTRGQEERVFTYENGKQIWW
ncbi:MULTISPECIES: discoidin domain-containing protein [Bacteroidales]|uniref:discoidin domain-containing protein n=1 Tax=Bacteroides pyogenes TaxID=310300 RepID=UPI002F93AF1F